MSFSVPQRAAAVFCIPPEFLSVLAFEIDQQAKAHRAHNTDEPVKGWSPRRKVSAKAGPMLWPRPISL